MAVRTRTRDALLGELDELVRSVKSAGELFDQGRYVEAKVLAAQVSRLVHEADGSRSLIERLGVANRLTWVDTAGVLNPKASCSAACLTLMKVRTGAKGYGEYVPKLSLYPPAPIRTRSGGHIDRGSRIPFDHWWTNPVVKDADGAEYSRKQLVLALAGKDTAHADAETAAAYAALAGSPSLGWVVSEGPGSATSAFERNPVMASVRQIGFEVLQTIRQQRDVIEAAAAE
jgi:hypothetical protein